MNGEQFNVYQDRIGSFVTDLQRLDFYVPRMCNLVIISFLRTKATIVAFVAKGLKFLSVLALTCFVGFFLFA